MTDEIFNRRRKKLEKELIDAALNLFEHMQGASGAQLVIPNTEPPIYIVIGDADALPQLVP